MATGLSHDGLPRNHVEVGGHLGRNVCSGVHAHVYELTESRHAMMKDRRQRRQHRIMTAGLIPLISATSNRWNRMVVVPAAPRRPTSRKNRKVRRGLVAARCFATEGRHRHVYQPGIDFT